MNNLSKYNKDGSYKENGETKYNENFSLAKLVGNCTDFTNELTMLQYTGMMIGMMNNIVVSIE